MDGTWQKTDSMQELHDAENDPWSVDDSLTELERFCLFANSGIDLQRWRGVDMLKDALESHPKKVEAVALVLPLIEQLSQDKHQVVRQHLAEQLPAVAILLHDTQLGESGYEYIINVIIPTLKRLVFDDGSNAISSDKDEDFDYGDGTQVRTAACHALVAVARLIKREDLVPHVLTIALQLAHEDSRDELRITAALLINALAPWLGPDICAEFVGPETISLAEDVVRKAVAQNIGLVLKAALPNYLNKKLLPVLRSLACDLSWAVRKACADGIVTVAIYDVLVPMMLQFCADSKKWVRQAAYKRLGRFIATLEDENIYKREAINPKNSSSLLRQRNLSDLVDEFTLIFEKCVKNDTNTSHKTRNVSKVPGLDISFQAAIAFPAVLRVAGPHFWQRLRSTYHYFSKHRDCTVRTAASSSLCDIALTLSMRSAFDDDVEEIDTTNHIKPISDTHDDVEEIDTTNYTKPISDTHEEGDTLQQSVTPLEKHSMRPRMPSFISSSVELEIDVNHRDVLSEELELISLYRRFISDKSVEVRLGCLRHVGGFLACLRWNIRERVIKEAGSKGFIEWGINVESLCGKEYIDHVISPDRNVDANINENKYTSKTYKSSAASGYKRPQSSIFNWRLRWCIAAQLVPLVQLFSLNTTIKYILPLTLALRNDDVACVQSKSLTGICTLLHRFIVTADENCHMILPKYTGIDRSADVNIERNVSRTELKKLIERILLDLEGDSHKKRILLPLLCRILLLGCRADADLSKSVSGQRDFGLQSRSFERSYVSPSPWAGLSVSCGPAEIASQAFKANSSIRSNFHRRGSIGMNDCSSIGRGVCDSSVAVRHEASFSLNSILYGCIHTNVNKNSRDAEQDEIQEVNSKKKDNFEKYNAPDWYGVRNIPPMRLNFFKKHFLSALLKACKDKVSNVRQSSFAVLTCSGFSFEFWNNTQKSDNNCSKVSKDCIAAVVAAGLEDSSPDVIWAAMACVNFYIADECHRLKSLKTLPNIDYKSDAENSVWKKLSLYGVNRSSARVQLAKTLVRGQGGHKPASVDLSIWRYLGGELQQEEKYPKSTVLTRLGCKNIEEMKTSKPQKKTNSIMMLFDDSDTTDTSNIFIEDGKEGSSKQTVEKNLSRRRATPVFSIRKLA